MEYTPSQFVSLLNPCDYNHNDLPFIRTKAHDRKPSLLACHNLHQIKKIRKRLEEGDLIGDAIKNADVSPASYYDWVRRYHSKRLKKYIKAAIERGYTSMDFLVENAFYKKLKEGRGTGSEYQFFLTNRMPTRWKNTTEFAPADGSGVPLLQKRPVINYIAVHAENATVEVSGNGHDNGGNGNGKRIEQNA